MVSPGVGVQSTDPALPVLPDQMTAQPTASEPPAPEPTPLEPVTVSERIFTIDVLRGIALLGVLIANIWLWFSGAIFLFPGLQSEMRQISLNSIAFYFVGIFISGKALSTFSFLFGLGFAVQMMRSEARGARIAPVYSRRLAVLLVIGAIHGVLLWYGDILLTYAMLGFALLLFRRRKDRTLLVWATILIAVIPIALGSVPLIMSLTGADMGPPPAEQIAKMTEENRTNLRLLSSGNYLQIIRGNLRMLADLYASPKAFSMLMFLGLFLLGLYAGRRRLFENVAAYRVALRRVMVWGFVIGLSATFVSIALRVGLDIEQAMKLPWFPLAMMTSLVFGTTPFAFAYIAAATLILEHPVWRARLRGFAPVGRMALTNYLSQTLICLAIFYGGHLIGSYRPALYLLVAVLIFAVQMQWSAWWLARYRFGPMEWVWRSLTYGRKQPMRIGREPLAASDAVG
jgi:uncharacterized protein